jgi:NifB/MoaA-like Fe-S oxidoreductase
MVRRMLDDWARTKRRLLARPLRTEVRSAVIATATLITPLLEEVAVEFTGRTGVRVTVVPVTNTVFGERVNVSGLLCGQDYARALQGRDDDLAILPRPSLDYFGRHFLDSMTIEELEGACRLPVAFASRWSDVVRILERGIGRPSRSSAANGAFWAEARESLPPGAAWEA